MNVTTKFVVSMITGEILQHEYYQYSGPVALACGATAGLENAAADQTAFFKQMVDQTQQVFGAGSQAFQSLMKTFGPIVAAGPNQRGFSLPESQALKSSAITNTGIAARNAKQATGEEMAAVGGGNMPQLPNGATAGINAAINTKFAGQTANELNQIEQADFQQGRENWASAVKGELAAPDVFNPAANMSGETGKAGENMINAENDVAEAQNSPWNAAIGALGGIAGQAVGGYFGGMASKTKSSGNGQNGQ